MARASGVSVSSVQRIWRAHGLQPHYIRQFKLSTDPAFVDKLRDVVGLYVDPPAHAVVLSVDEKSQIQALDRTQPGLPMKKGRAGTMTHDYKRNGTTTLFAAMNILDGTVIGRATAIRSSSGSSTPSSAKFPPARPFTRFSTQLCRSQASRGEEMAGVSSALDFPFHPNFRLLAQRRRRLLRAEQATAQARRFPLR
jgi:hypothetical protein